MDAQTIAFMRGAMGLLLDKISQCESLRLQTQLERDIISGRIMAYQTIYNTLYSRLRRLPIGACEE